MTLVIRAITGWVLWVAGFCPLCVINIGVRCPVCSTSRPSLWFETYFDMLWEKKIADEDDKE